MSEDSQTKTLDQQPLIPSEKKVENRRRRPAVWVQKGTRTKNRLGVILGRIILEAKKDGKTDEEAFNFFAEHPEVLHEIKNHENETVRNWSKSTLIEAAKSRMRSDMKLMMKDKNIPVETVDDFPDVFPKTLFRRKRKSVLEELWVSAGGTLNDD